MRVLEPEEGVAIRSAVLNLQDEFLVERMGDIGLMLRVRPVDVSEFAKAEGGVTCMSLIFSLSS